MGLFGRKRNKRHHNKASKKRGLKLESLEKRELMAADLQPFDGSADLFQIHGTSGDQGQLSTIDIAENAFEDVGKNTGYKINATGYRVADDLIYGIKVDARNLVRIGANGNVENLGKVNGLPKANYYSADFGPDGLLYLWTKDRLYGVNVDTQNVDREVKLSRRTGSTPDIAYDPETELMYGVENAGKKRNFISIDVTNGDVQTINNDFQPSNGVFGAMFADATGRVFAGNNRGGLYEVNKLTGVSTFVAHTPRATSNDGSSPSTAVMNLPPVMQHTWVSMAEGTDDFALNLDEPVDPEGDDITITVSQLPSAGVVKLADGTALKVGDKITSEQLQNLLYDAPETAEEVTDLIFELSDGRGTSKACAQVQISGKSMISGYVDVVHDSDDDTYDGYAFNNTITLEGTADDGEVVSLKTTSNEHGYYEFKDLKPGKYEVIQEQPATVKDWRTSGGDLDATEGTNKITSIMIPNGLGKSFTGFDFYEYAPSSVTGFVYIDGDADGALHSLDRGVSGTVVHLTGDDDRGIPVSATTTTGSFGFYEFTGLRPGNYSITEIQPEGYVSRSSNVGTEGGAEGENVISDIELGAGLPANHNDFGELQKASLTGHVYLDQDFDKVKDRGDSGIEGVTVTLSGTDMLGNEILVATQTDSEGDFLFDALLPGTYKLVETQPEMIGLVDGRENLGNFIGQPGSIARNGKAGQDEFTDIQLEQGDQARGYDFTETVEYILAKDFDNSKIFTGTSGNDTFEFTAGETVHTVTLNGEEYTFDASKIHDIQFIGLAGDDTVTITGSENVEQVTLRHLQGAMHSERFQVRAFQSEYITMNNGGGFDRAYMYDTEGDDKFKGTESYGRMWGDGYQNQANGYHRLYAFATEGEDRAYLHDSKKDDTVKASADRTRMFSSKYYNSVKDFDRVYAYANSGGFDSAILWDSAADGDVLEASPEKVRMFNAHFYNQVEGFEEVESHANAGGENDRAYLFDSKGDDIFVSSPSESGIKGDGFSFVIDTFERVYAYASEGTDKAYLYDSKLDDKFVAYHDNVRLYNDQYYLRADDFDQVDAYSSSGGDDRAYFYDSEGDDTLVSLENEVRMFGDGFDNTSHGFARAYAWSENGGVDTAHLFDSAQADTLKQNDDSTRMYAEGYYTKASNFGTVNVEFSDVSNQDRAIVFGQVSQDTLSQAGDLAKTMNKYGATYIEGADIVFNGLGDDGSDDDQPGDTSDDFAFVPEKI